MSDSSLPNSALQREKLNLSTKLAYGVGDFGSAVSSNILIFFQLIFLTNVAGLSPVLAGSIRTIAGIWDAVNDPMVGVLSDRTRTRWGRRYPWMFVGAIPLGIFFVLQWVVPQFSTDPGRQEISLFWFYVIISVLFNVAFTAVNLPYTALTPELTQDYDERTTLNQYRFTFSLTGAVLSLVFAQIIFTTIDNPIQQYLWISGICGLLCVIPPYLCIWGTRRRAAQFQSQVALDDQTAPSLSIGQQLRIAFSNRPFLCVIGIYLFSWLALQNTASIIPYYVANWMGLPAQHSAQVALAVQGSAVLVLWIWSAISQRVGKRGTYFMGMGVWILAQIGLMFLQPGQVGLMYGLAIVAGFGVSVAYLIPWAMLPDVIELDELRTGQRREGIFYSFMVFLQKIGLAIGQLLIGVVLGAAGFDGSAQTQPESALLAIRAAIGPLPALFLVCGIAIAYFYPITREVYAEILLKLNERRSAQASENS
jgi:GPH family glycoside/pentoside/hexuronide:cation symporter